MTGENITAERHNILGIDIDLIDYERAFKTIAYWHQRSEKHYIAITNPHSVLLCHKNEKMQQATADASLTLPDGAGIILAANLLGYKTSGRVAGPTLMLKLCDWGADMVSVISSMAAQKGSQINWQGSCPGSIPA